MGSAAEKLKKEVDALQKENQGLKIEIRDFARQISTMEMRFNVQKKDCEVPAMPMPVMRNYEV